VCAFRVLFAARAGALSLRLVPPDATAPPARKGIGAKAGSTTTNRIWVGPAVFWVLPSSSDIVATASKHRNACPCI
jgi:hypothetical protein